jgi:hypothetical protein
MFSNQKKTTSWKSQQGQTLIETMVAVFIMVMGITAALGLANYSLNASTGIRKGIIGMGLAREGMEAVKNMRDTNWLNGTISSNCYNYATLGDPAYCYRDWLNATGGFNFNMSGLSHSYRLIFDASTSSHWTLVNASNNWALDNTTNPSLGFYTIGNPNTGLASGTSGYYRKITIARTTTAPFDKPTAAGSDVPRLTVTSQVWWTDKNCPASLDWPGANKCSIQLQTYLTNWKTY